MRKASMVVYLELKQFGFLCSSDTIKSEESLHLVQPYKHSMAKVRGTFDLNFSYFLSKSGILISHRSRKNKKLTVWVIVTGLLALHSWNCQRYPAKNLVSSFHPFVQIPPVVSHITSDKTESAYYYPQGPPYSGHLTSHLITFCLIYSAVATLAPLLTLGHSECTSTQGHLHLLFLQPELLFLQISAWLALSLPEFRPFPTRHLFNIAFPVEISYNSTLCLNTSHLSCFTFF